MCECEYTVKAEVVKQRWRKAAALLDAVLLVFDAAGVLSSRPKLRVRHGFGGHIQGRAR